MHNAKPSSGKLVWVRRNTEWDTAPLHILFSNKRLLVIHLNAEVVLSRFIPSRLRTIWTSQMSGMWHCSIFIIELISILNPHLVQQTPVHTTATQRLLYRNTNILSILIRFKVMDPIGSKCGRIISFVTSNAMASPVCFARFIQFRLPEMSVDISSHITSASQGSL